jgi:hypothetical protein
MIYEMAYPTARHLKIKHPRSLDPSGDGKPAAIAADLFFPRGDFFPTSARTFSTLQSPTFAILRLVRARLHPCSASLFYFQVNPLPISLPFAPRPSRHSANIASLLHSDSSGR